MYFGMRKLDILMYAMRFVRSEVVNKGILLALTLLIF